MKRSSQRPRESGIILIAVLLAVAIMSVMVVATTALTRAGAGSEELDQRRLQTHLGLRSALEVIKAFILSTPPEERALFDGSAFQIAVGNDLSASVEIRDAAGLVDLNQTQAEVIEALGRDMGLSLKEVSGLAAKIAKLRGEDPVKNGTVPAKAPAPAKPAAAAAAQPPAAGLKPGESLPPKPTVFLSVDQLQPLADLTTEEGQAFADALTVFNPTGRINPLAAPEAVLNVLPGFAPADLTTFAAVKKSRKWKNDARVAQSLDRMKDVAAIEEPTVFVIDIKLDKSAGVLSGAKLRAVVRLAADKGLPFRTLALKEN